MISSPSLPFGTRSLPVAAVLFFGMLAGAVADPKVYTDLTYAEIGPRQLQLDLVMPEGVEKPPLLVVIHGGGWRKGSRKKVNAKPYLEAGYAVASIDYRLSTEAVFPAQIHDCKGAVRWLRAHAGEYGYDADRVAAVGSSAGGHLALLLGLTGGDAQYEGNVGGNTDQSSKVMAVVDFYGPTDFLLRAKDQPKETDMEGGKVYMLLGGSVQNRQDLARLASPAWQVDAGDAPIITLHGDMDSTVLINQSQRLVEECREEGVPIEFYTVPGNGHGGPGFGAPENRKRVRDFLEKYVKKSS